MRTLKLPTADGTLAGYTLTGNTLAAAPRPRPRWNRIAFAAVHVVADPRANVDPWLAAAIDWDATLAYRRYLWAAGLGVAEAMDTAQRGMGLDWPTSLELIRRTVAEARHVEGAVVFSGAGTDLPSSRTLRAPSIASSMRTPRSARRSSAPADA